MQEIAIIELVEYQRHESWYKPSHAWINNLLETTVESEKHYKLKFSNNCEGKYRFCDWVKEKWGHYAWWDDPRDLNDVRYFPRSSDENVIPEGYDCFCQAQTEFLLENWFKLQSVGNTCHFFNKD